MATHHRSTFQPWIVCLSAGLYFFYEFVQMTMINSIGSNLMHDFSLNTTQLGLLSAVYFVAIILFVLPTGMIIDRFSIRKMLITALATSIAGTIFFALSNSIVLSAVCHFTSGIGHNFSFLIPMTLAARWFPSEKRALVMSIIVTMGMLGAIFTQTVLTELATLFNWRYALLINAALGLVFMSIIILCVQDYPPDCPIEKCADFSVLKIFKHFLAVIKSVQNWCCGIYASFLNLPIILLGAIWGILYLEHTFNLSKANASFVISMIFIGMIIGSPLVGFFTSNIRSKKFVMFISALLAALVISVIIYETHLSMAMLILLFFLLGMVTSTQVLIYPIIAENNPVQLTGTAISFASLLVMSSGLFFQPLFGWILDLQKHWDIKHHLSIYSAVNFRHAIYIMPVAFLICSLLALVIKDK